MDRLLVIVSAEAPARFEYLKYVFGDTVDVIVDRREHQRRGPGATTAGGKRRTERRQHDIDKDLATSGWALVRR
jgi:hypothetical protein